MSTSAEFLNVAGSIGGVANAVGALASFPGGDWQSSLQPASFGGVPFGVDSARTRAGRRQAIHVYPYRDDVWIEDQGKQPRQFRVNGFLIEDSLVYGGGGVIGQREALLSVCESGAVSTLVHPTFGVVSSINCLEIEIDERKDLGRVFEFTMTLMVSGIQQYPSTLASTADALTAAASALQAQSLVDLARNVARNVQLGAAVVRQAVSTAVGYYQMAVGLTNAVNRVFNSVSTLSGNFGAYSGGGNTGYTAANARAPVTTTASELLAAGAASVGMAVAAGQALQASAANIADTDAYGASAVEFTQALAATADDPADGIALLSSLSGYRPAALVPSASPIGVASASISAAVAAHLRRLSIVALVQAAGAYQPSSQNDAAATQQAVTAVLDAEIVVAGDAGDDASYDALRALRKAAVADMQARGAGLAAISTFTFGAQLPALVLANRIYRDATRADGLSRQAAPVHPAFMPLSFQALAA